MSNGDGLLATWPKTGHRLVRALDREAYSVLVSGSIYPIDAEPNRKDDAGSSVGVFIVAPGEKRFLVRIGIDFVDHQIWAITSGEKIAIGGGLFRSIWPYLPQNFRPRPSLSSWPAQGPSGLLQGDWWLNIDPVDPGPLVPTKDVAIFRFLGLKSPWFESRVNLKAFLEED